MKWFSRFAGLLLLAGLAWWTWQRLFVTDETRIQRAIASMESAVEEGNLLRLEAGIAQDYSDDHGLDKATLLGAVRSFRAQQDAIFIHISELRITVAPDRQTAQAAFIAKVLVKPKGALAESELRADRHRLSFRNTDQGWRMTRAESPELKFD